MNIITAGTRKITIPNFGPVVPARPRGGEASPLLTDLVGYWKLDEAAGTRADSHGSNDLTDINTVTQAVGKVGNAAEFVKLDETRLFHADNAELSLGDIDFTVAFWCNITTEQSAQFIVCKDAASGNREFVVAARTSGGDSFQFSVFRPTDVEISLLNSMEISTGVWYFVVAWHDATLDKTFLQVDNGTPTERTTGGSLQATGTADFTIGARSGGTALWYDGLVDEAGLWKRVLTADERTELYNGGDGITYPF